MAARRGSERQKAGASASARVSSQSPSDEPREPRVQRGDGPYKLLAIDLDGTLLPHGGEAFEEDVRAIKKLKARGVKVTILTGRLFSGARPSAELLGIDGPVGCADGSHVVHMKGHKTLLHHGIRGNAADLLRASLERENLIAFLFAEDAIIHDERGADYLQFVKTWSTDLRYVHRVTEHPLWDSPQGMTAVVALGRESNIARAVADIQRDETESLQVAMFPFRRDVSQWGMVARAAGGTKATALAWVAAHHGVSVAESVVVGDWHNDLPMLATAGRSFAMGQSPPEIKAAATDVLERTIEQGGGIAEAITRAFGHAR